MSPEPVAMVGLRHSGLVDAEEVSSFSIPCVALQV